MIKVTKTRVGSHRLNEPNVLTSDQPKEFDPAFNTNIDSAVSSLCRLKSSPAEAPTDYLSGRLCFLVQQIFLVVASRLPLKIADQQTAVD